MPLLEIQNLGKMAIGIVGPSVVKKFIPKYLKKITPDACYDQIQNNRDLFMALSDGDWDILRKIAKKAQIELTKESVLQELNTNNPVVWSVVMSTPGGEEWLERQIVVCRQRLGYT